MEIRQINGKRIQTIQALAGLPGPTGAVGTAGFGYAIVSQATTIPANPADTPVVIEPLYFLPLGGEGVYSINGIDGKLKRALNGNYLFRRDVSGAALALVEGQSAFVPKESKSIPLVFETVANLKDAPAPSTNGVTRKILGYFLKGDCEIPLVKWNNGSFRNDPFAYRPNEIASNAPGRYELPLMQEYDVQWGGCIVSTNQNPAESTTSWQAIHDYCAAQYPVVGRRAKSGFIKLGKVIDRGVPFKGSGIDKTILVGLPKTDMFYFEDESIGEITQSQYAPNITDCTIWMDCTQTPTTPPAVNPEFNRPCFPLTGTWSQATVYERSTWVKNSAGKIYFSDFGGTSGTSEPTHTVGSVCDGKVWWDFISDEQVYVGHAAIALPIKIGHATHPRYSIDGVLDKVRIVRNPTHPPAIGNIDTSKAAGIFCQRSPYHWVTATKIEIVFISFGIVFVPPTENFRVQEYCPDEISATSLQLNFCNYPLIVYNALRWNVDLLGVYATFVGQRSIYLLNALCGVRIEGYFNEIGLYCEPNSATSGLFCAIYGRGHHFPAAIFKQAYGSLYMLWGAHGCTVASFRTGISNSLVLTGKGNDFQGGMSQSANDNIIEMGLASGNNVIFSHFEQSLKNNPGFVQKGSIVKIHKQPSHDYLDSGHYNNPYPSKDALFIPGSDLQTWTNGIEAISMRESDLAASGGTFVRLKVNAFAYTETFPFTIVPGRDIPYGRVKLIFMARSVGSNLTQQYYLVSGNNSTTVSSFAATTNFQIFSKEIDFSLFLSDPGIPLLFAFLNPFSPGNTFDIAWLYFSLYDEESLGPSGNQRRSVGKPQTSYALVGDRSWEYYPSPSKPRYYECIQEGSPGLWRAVSTGARGLSSERPILDVNDAGFDYRDVNLGKPIYWWGTNWKDATGTLVI